jgi:hypothetical protein
MSTQVVFVLGFICASLLGSQPLLSSTKVRDCTYDECHASGCDASTAPFLCVDPLKAHYGCSPTPWTEMSCGDGCSLEHCAETSPSVNQKSCRGVSCGEERCGTDYQKCGADAPFQCVTGSAAMGCSSNEFDWMTVSDDLCSSCCDTNAC